MKSATRIWLVFAACVVLLATILAGLALWTLRLERERAAARQQLVDGRNALALEERINSAFWRIDSLLTLLISQEAARDPADYAPFLAVETEGRGFAPAGSPEPSPLLETPSEFVRLHFQVAGDGTVTSPQAPQASVCEMAISCGADLGQMTKACQLLEELRPELGFQQVRGLCPTAGNFTSVRLAPWVVEQNRPAPLGNDSGSGPALPLWADRNAVVDKEPGTNRSWFLERAANVDRAMASYIDANGGREVDSRAKQTANAMLNIHQSNQQQQGLSAGEPAAVGLMRPVWLGARLLLVREVIMNGEAVIQGCWLDWDRLAHYLEGEVGDLFSDISFSPVRPDQPINPARTLTTLPVAIDFPAGAAIGLPLPPGDAPVKGGVWPALVAASLTSLLAVVALGVLLAGVQRLSERRATFVSAVSHELRTPLTTFRLYSEMLADGMVTDPAKQAEYLQTLKSEAERLGHLVDNVLTYAGLDRRTTATIRQRVQVAQLLDRARPVLERMTHQAGCRLSETLEPDALQQMVETDVAAVERVLVNLVDNGLKYGRDEKRPEISLNVRRDLDWIEIGIRDYGPGVSAARRKKMFDEFSRCDEDAAGSQPGVGLGLALSRRIARGLDARLVYEPREPGSAFLLRLPVAPELPESGPARQTRV